VADAQRGYAANVSLLDEHVGYLLWKAAEEGLLDDTLVIFASDHGELAGEHGRWGKQCMYEEAIRVPMMMWHKGIQPRAVNGVVGLIDIFPTVCEWLGVPCPETDGVSLLKDRPDDYHVFVEVFWGKYVSDQYCDFDHNPLSYQESVINLRRCIRRGQWKYVDDGSHRELFHVTNKVCRQAGQKSPKLMERFRKEMEDLYPIENIISKFQFERHINEKAFG
jgi:arylsulfatase A-like enzyme